MKFRAIIEPALGHRISKGVIEFSADDFDAASEFINTVQRELTIRGMCTVMRIDGGEDKTGLGSITAQTSKIEAEDYPLFKEQVSRHNQLLVKAESKCFDCDDGAQDCHMNCGPST